MRCRSRTLIAAITLSVIATPMATLAAPAGAAAPGAPSITGVTAGDRALAVHWSAGSGSSASFVARIASDHSKTCTASSGDYPPNTCTIGGLTNGLPSNPLRNDGASVVSAEGSPTRF